MTTTGQKHVGVLVETSRAYGRGVASGVIAFARQHDWILYPQESGLLHGLPPWLKRVRLDGLVVDIYTRSMAHQLKRLNLPVVDTYCEGLLETAPSVETDPEAAGQMAADFFIQAGFTRFAFCGYRGIYFSDSRERAFQKTIAARGYPCEIYTPPATVTRCHNLFMRERGGMEYDHNLARWLRHLPKPVAIFACNDIRGQHLLNACRDFGIPAPGEVTVVGMDNDRLICEMSHPTLSSIVPDSEGVGRKAAELLNRMIHQQRSQKIPILRQVLPPLRIIERQSTDIVPEANPIVVQGSRLIRDGACQGLTVPLLCDKLGLGRTRVDALFKKRLGRTAAAEILRIRLAHAKRLLLDTRLPLREVSRQAGFLTVPHFCRTLKRETGLAPLQFRNTVENQSPEC